MTLSRTVICAGVTSMASAVYDKSIVVVYQSINQSINDFNDIAAYMLD